MKLIKSIQIGILLFIVGSFFAKTANTAPPLPRSTHQALLSVDGVELILDTPVLPNEFLEPEPDSLLQVASSVRWSPYQEISITAIPYGLKSGTERSATVKAGAKKEFRANLTEYRLEHAELVESGPTANIFGDLTDGIVSVTRYNDGYSPNCVVIAEWVAEAGQRIWIIRAVQECRDATMSANEVLSMVKPLSELRLNSPDVNSPSASYAARYNEQTPHLTQPAVQYAPNEPSGNLPTPSWWDGDCDKNYYHAHAGRWAYPLGSSYRGVKTCGPRPYFDSAPDVTVYFFSGAHAELEWECVEVSMRYLYLAYGIAPYSANGKDVVWNYSGSRLVKIQNGTAGKPPKPGDVISYNKSSPYGHTAVVISSNVDGNGNGSITVMDQNDASNGIRGPKTVSNWHVQDGLVVSGWLHDPLMDDTIPPVTSVSLSGQHGSNNWYRSSVQVTLSAADNSGGSGVKRTYVKSDDETTWLWYIDPFTISGEGVHTVTYKSEDNAGNVEPEKQIVLGIDTTAPTGSLAVNNNASVSRATLVSLNTTVTDALSGVSKMRIRNAGNVWNGWQPYTAAASWLLPRSTGQTFGVNIQFKDQAGNESNVYTDTIPLDIYPAQPASNNYRLQKTTLGVSGSNGSSANYQLHGTLGQPSTVNVISSTNYTSSWGYWQAKSIAANTVYLPLIMK